MWAENNKRKESGECLIVLSPRVVCLFWGSSFARCPYGDVFLFRRYRDMCQLFKLVRQISQNRYGHHVPAKSCAGSWATFLSKKFSRLHGFFKKEVLKKRYFWVFYVWSPIYQNQDQIQGPWFRVIYKSFIGYSFAQKRRLSPKIDSWTLHHSLSRNFIFWWNHIVIQYVTHGFTYESKIFTALNGFNTCVISILVSFQN